MKVSPRRLFRSIGYALLFLGIGLITILLVAIGRGYRIDFKTGQIYGGGLLIVDSLPNGAQVSIDGKPINVNTPAKISLRAGRYRLSLAKDGYRSWQKDIQVNTSQITWVQYPFLIPTTITTTSLARVSQPAFLQQSPNRRLLALATNGAKPAVSMLVIGSSDLKTVYQLSSSLAKQKFLISAIAWAPDNRHILISLKTKNQTHYLVVDGVSQSGAVDISNLFKLPLSSLSFNDQNWQELYGLSAGSLRKLNINDQTVSVSLAVGVETFIVSRGAPYYVRTNRNTREVDTLDSNGQIRAIVSGLTNADYQLAYIAYGGKRYLAVSAPQVHSVSLFDPGGVNQPAIDQFTAVKALNLWASPDNRYLVMQDGASFASFDFDQQTLFRFSISGVPQADPSWVDNDHLIAEVNGNLELFEFDGGNQEALTSARAGFMAFSSLDRRYIYSIGTLSTSAVLQISQIQN